VLRACPPATRAGLGVGEVIKAWDLALADMRKGEKRALLVPPNLVSGDRAGAGGYG
jgi:FKBP-type peptidyl-prolyl cis-trans isomerase